MTAPLLSLEHLAFGYSRTVVGRDVSAVLERGDTLALLGPNGSGKTTLFKAVIGLLEPLSGTIRVNGETITDWSPAQFAKTFGYVPQAATGYFPFTVLEMVLMGRTARLSAFAAPSHADRMIALRALDDMSIAHLADRDFTRISGGERQLTLIARALAQEPLVLILDEPTASLDFSNQLRLLNLIRELAARGLGVLFSTHHPDQALAVASHALLLKGGETEAIGTACDVLTAERLSALFGVELAVEYVAGSFVCVPHPNASSRTTLTAQRDALEARCR
jgi:iron complex transport system ATP-binding protein